ncbi:MAG: exopolysaccharide biosynthesis protein [Reichenbachiella sp.]
MSEKKDRLEDEIDLIELVKTIWAGRKFIAKVTGTFVLLGLFIALTSRVEYEASCKLLPESQEGSTPNLGGLGGLAGLAGIDLGSMSQSGVLSPQLYPEIVNSLPFILEVMHDTIFFEKNDLKTTSFHYFKEIQRPTLFGYLTKYTIGLPGLINESITSDPIIPEEKSEFIRLTKKDWKIIEKFKERISINLNDETGIVAISVEMPDPYAAAQLSKRIELMVTEAVTKYKTDKAQNNLSFVKETFSDAKSEFKRVQLKLAKITDRNRNVSSALAEIELRNVENEYNLTFEVYKGLASQVEQAKIKLKEETPVFTVLEPVRIPEDKSKPKRRFIVIAFTICGFLVGAGRFLILAIFEEPK